MLLKKHVEAKDDKEIMDLLLEIYKVHRKCTKHMNQKDNLFGSVLVDVYKAFVEDKVKLPDGANLQDLAIKLCDHEIKFRKKEKEAREKGSVDGGGDAENALPSSSVSSNRIPYIPGLSKPRKSLEKTPKAQPASAAPKVSNPLQGFDPLNLQALYKNSFPTASSSTAPQQSAFNDSTGSLADLYRSQTVNPFAGLPNLNAMLLQLLQHQSLYNQLPNLTSLASAPNYNQFMAKYVEDLATKSLGIPGLNPLGPSGSSTNLKSGKSALQNSKQPKPPSGTKPKEKKAKSLQQKLTQEPQQSPMSLLKDIAAKGGVSVLPIRNNDLNLSPSKIPQNILPKKSNQQSQPKKRKIDNKLNTVSLSSVLSLNASVSDIAKQLALPKSLTITPSSQATSSSVLNKIKEHQMTSHLIPKAPRSGTSVGNAKPKSKKSNTASAIPQLKYQNLPASISVIPDKKLQSPFQLEFAKQVNLSQSIDLTAAVVNNDKPSNSLANNSKKTSTKTNYGQTIDLTSPPKKKHNTMTSKNSIPTSVMSISKVSNAGASGQLPNKNTVKLPAISPLPKLNLPDISMSPVLSISPSGSSGKQKTSSSSNRATPIPRNSPVPQQQLNKSIYASSKNFSPAGGATGISYNRNSPTPTLPQGTDLR